MHAATATEQNWGWYGGLVGARFWGHPAVQQATLRVERPSHASTHHLGATWKRTDEWYSFLLEQDGMGNSKPFPRDDMVVLLSLDESSYAPGALSMGDHPIAWYKGWDGGRSFQTALGHTSESWSDPAFMDHVWGRHRVGRRPGLGSAHRLGA